MLFKMAEGVSMNSNGVVGNQQGENVVPTNLSNSVFSESKFSNWRIVFLPLKLRHFQLAGLEWHFKIQMFQMF